jgi:hypothetical protein
MQAEDAEATTSSSDEETDAVKDPPAAANGTAAAAAAPGAAKAPGLKSGTAEGGRLVQEEQSATGGVSWAVVKAYINALGGYPVVFLLFSIFILAELFRVGATVWLSIWTGEQCYLGFGQVWGSGLLPLDGRLDRWALEFEEIVRVGVQGWRGCVAVHLDRWEQLGSWGSQALRQLLQKAEVYADTLYLILVTHQAKKVSLAGSCSCHCLCLA